MKPPRWRHDVAWPQAVFNRRTADGPSSTSKVGFTLTGANVRTAAAATAAETLRNDCIGVSHVFGWKVPRLHHLWPCAELQPGAIGGSQPAEHTLPTSSPSDLEQIYPARGSHAEACPHATLMRANATSAIPFIDPVPSLIGARSMQQNTTKSAGTL